MELELREPLAVKSLPVNSIISHLPLIPKLERFWVRVRVRFLYSTSIDQVQSHDVSQFLM